MLADIERYENPSPHVPDIETRSTIGELTRSADTFYLGGSRYFGCERPESDWDFLVQHTPAVETYLNTIGFKRMMDAEVPGWYDASDGHTVAVMEKGRVQVQLRQNVLLTRKVRDVIYREFWQWHLHATKQERRDMWQAMHEAVAVAW